MIVIIEGDNGVHEFHGDFCSIEVTSAEDGGFDVDCWEVDSAKCEAELWGKTVHIVNDTGAIVATYEDGKQCTCGCKED